MTIRGNGFFKGGLWQSMAIAGLWAGMVVGAQAATFTIDNQNASNDGLNDRTQVAPVGGNDARTLGAQRLAVIRYAAQIVGSRVGSHVPIRLASQFQELECDARTAVLGNGSPTQESGNFTGARRANTFYPIALANALAGQRLADTDDIRLVFNSRLDDGDGDCIQGISWYYGLDGKTPPGELDFLGTVVHEITHGLGFISLVALQDTDDSSMGQFPQTSRGDRWPDIYSSFIRDLSLPGKPLWTDITDRQRAASITNGPDVVFSDSATSDAAGGLLSAGTNQGYVKLYAPATVEVGSSISHWDSSLTPNQIMEPSENPDSSVLDGIGLSSCALEAMGWTLINGTRCPDENSGPIAGSDDNAQAGNDSNASDDDGDDDHHGGGGCTIDTRAGFDPLWFMLLMLSGGVLIWRRRSKGI